MAKRLSLPDRAALAQSPGTLELPEAVLSAMGSLINVLTGLFRPIACVLLCLPPFAVPAMQQARAVVCRSLLAVFRACRSSRRATRCCCRATASAGIPVLVVAHIERFALSAAPLAVPSGRQLSAIAPAGLSSTVG